MGNQLQADLTALRAAQQESDAEIERQRGLLAKEYASAIQKAQADNDLAMAQALYEDAQRKEEQMLAKQEAGANLLAQYGDFSGVGSLYGLTPAQVAKLTQDYTTQKERPDKEAAANLMAQYGDFSGVGSLYGLTPAQIAKLTQDYTTEKDASKEEAAAQIMAQTGDYSRLGALYGLSDAEVKKLSGASTGSVSTGKPTGNKPAVKNWDNEGISKAKIKEMQLWYGTKDDGYWGSNSTDVAGGRSAKAAWDYYQANKDVAVNRFIANHMTSREAARRGISKQQWKNDIIEDLNNANFTAAEIAELEKHYGIS
jgi:hypothetical protein